MQCINAASAAIVIKCSRVGYANTATHAYTGNEFVIAPRRCHVGEKYHSLKITDSATPWALPIKNIKNKLASGNRAPIRVATMILKLRLLAAEAALILLEPCISNGAAGSNMAVAINR